MSTVNTKLQPKSEGGVKLRAGFICCLGLYWRDIPMLPISVMATETVTEAHLFSSYFRTALRFFLSWSHTYPLISCSSKNLKILLQERHSRHHENEFKKMHSN